jgi:TolB-like protein/tetratricopeptide (TPR) repeat protein
VSNPSQVSPEETVSPTAVAQELERIAMSACFRKAARCVLLLRHVTTLTLEGRAGELKEYSLGVTVFERPPSYDPRVDPIVRLEARRLRLKLSEYYQQEGLNSPVIIDLPKGAYVPYFRLRPGLELPPAPVTAVTAVVPKRPFPRMIAAVVAVVLMAGIFVAARFILHRGGVVSAIRPSVAVLGFRDLSARPENSWIATALTEMMNIDLGSSHQLRIVPPDRVAQMRAELTLGQNNTYSVEDLRRVRADLDTDYVVTGSYSSQDGQIRLDVMLFDARAGKQMAAFADQGGQANLSELVERCSAPITNRLRSPADEGRNPILSEGPSQPSMDPAAMESYARGMERLRQSDALGARSFLENAVSEAPSNPLAHSALAAAWSLLGQDAKAQSEAKLAFDRASDLGRLEQLEVEGRYRTVAHDWPRAIQIYQALFTLLPDDLESGLLLASAQSRGGEAQNSLVTVSALRKLPAPLGDDPRIDLAEAQAAGAMSDFDRTRKAAGIAAQKALKKGARLQYAKARLLESGAMQNLAVAGYSDVRAEARRICTELGDRACVAAALRIEANNMVALGDLSTARHLYEDVLETSDQIGNLLERLNALNGLAYTSNLQGELRTAEKEYRLALQTASEMGPTKIYSIELDLADVLTAQGRVADAQALIAHALDIARSVGDKQGIAAGLSGWAQTLALKGNSSEAQSKYSQSIALLREVNDIYELHLTLIAQGDAFVMEGNIEGARRNFQEVQRIVRSFHGGWEDSEIKLAFARTDLAARHFADAETNARAALTGFTRSGREGDRVMAAALLARALVAEGKIQQASEAIAQSTAPEAKDFPVWVPLELQIAKADCLAHSGKPAEAAKMMDTATSTMTRLGLAGLEKEALAAKQSFLHAHGI